MLGEKKRRLPFLSFPVATTFPKRNGWVLIFAVWEQGRKRKRKSERLHGRKALTFFSRISKATDATTKPTRQESNTQQAKVTTQRQATQIVSHDEPRQSRQARHDGKTRKTTASKQDTTTKVRSRQQASKARRQEWLQTQPQTRVTQTATDG